MSTDSQNAQSTGCHRSTQKLAPFRRPRGKTLHKEFVTGVLRIWVAQMEHLLFIRYLFTTVVAARGVLFSGEKMLQVPPHDEPGQGWYCAVAVSSLSANWNCSNITTLATGHKGRWEATDVQWSFLTCCGRFFWEHCVNERIANHHHS